MTSKTVRKTLETEFGCDLTAQKKSITAVIMKLIQEIIEEEGETQTQEQQLVNSLVFHSGLSLRILNYLLASKRSQA